MHKTQNLSLPLILGSQSQKHVTHNEALVMLDVITQAKVLDKDLTEPPAIPSVGDAYIVGASRSADQPMLTRDVVAASNNWNNRGGCIAVCKGLRDNEVVWELYVPREGWIVWVIDERCLYVYVEGVWANLLALSSAVGSSESNEAAESAVSLEVAKIGIGTEVSEDIPLLAKLNRVALTAKTIEEGGTGDICCTLNKEGSSNTGALVFQANGTDCAKLELDSGNSLSFSVTDGEGVSWQTGLSIDSDATLRGLRGITPERTGRYNLGTYFLAWDSVHVRRGVIRGSDISLKTAIGRDVPGMEFVDGLEPVTYRYTEQDIQSEEEGKNGLCCGFIAQDVQKLLNGRDLALLVNDETSNQKGLRYDEFIAILVKAVQELSARLTVLEAKNQ